MNCDDANANRQRGRRADVSYLFKNTTSAAGADREGAHGKTVPTTRTSVR